MDFTTFSAVLTIYAHNFRVLHWGANGKKFDRMHKLADEYASMVSEDIDAIAEMGLRVGQPPISMANLMSTIENADDTYVIIEYKIISYDDFCKATLVMLAGILKCIAELRNSDLVGENANMGIKSTLEAMYDKYDLQARYLHARRSSIIDED